MKATKTAERALLSPRRISAKSSPSDLAASPRVAKAFAEENSYSQLPNTIEEQDAEEEEEEDGQEAAEDEEEESVPRRLYITGWSYKSASWEGHSSEVPQNQFCKACAAKAVSGPL